MRIVSQDGELLGCGILLDDHRVLTCAHVLPPSVGPPSVGPADTAAGVGVVQPLDPVQVVVIEEDRPYRADPVPGSVVPVQGDETGDIALLQLDQATYATPAALRRMSLRPGLEVAVRGCTSAYPDGLWVPGKVLGFGGPRGEWLQINAANGESFQRGFSGAGVYDNDTHTGALGMFVAVAEPDDQHGSIGFIIPVDTIVGHLPDLGTDPAITLGGVPKADHRFLTVPGSADSTPPDQPLNAIAQWLGRAPDGAVLVVVGEPQAGRSAALRTVVTGSSRLQSAPADGVDARSDTGLTPDKVDLALDAADLTVRQLRDHIAQRLGVPSEQLTDPRPGDVAGFTVVVDRLDEAADPRAFQRDLLVPLAGGGARVVIGARTVPDAITDAIPDATVIRVEASDFSERLDRLDTLIHAIAATERAAADRRIAAKFAGLPDAPARALSLRLDLVTTWRYHRQHPTDTAWVERKLDHLERRAARDLDRSRHVLAALDGAEARHRALCGRLSGAWVAARARARASWREVVSAHKRAERLSAARPCDLDALDRAVRHLEDLVFGQGGG